ncbi:hypothetical protein CEXT_314451 [Caerostris extrusa]|uniref:Uncharacterized protein n=1 Tax=Caerostris extrusa TaxID=172846 RepID=A0AAV4U4K8_CAEEX|nr:hypothetical protein CEXT_314451 [Caerostris extrusa]
MWPKLSIEAFYSHSEGEHLGDFKNLAIRFIPGEDNLPNWDNLLLSIFQLGYFFCTGGDTSSVIIFYSLSSEKLFSVVTGSAGIYCAWLLTVCFSRGVTKPSSCAGGADLFASSRVYLTGDGGLCMGYPWLLGQQGVEQD